MALKTLDDLFVDELRDLYNAENQLVKALPKMAKAASCPELRAAFEEHLTQTEGHVQRLEQIFEELGMSPKGKTCKAMKGLVEEGGELLEEQAEDHVRDAGLIGAAQRVEHYEMAGYGTAATFAHVLGHAQIERLLRATLKEEGDTNKKLTTLAESTVNAKAAATSE